MPVVMPLKQLLVAEAVEAVLVELELICSIEAPRNGVVRPASPRRSTAPRRHSIICERAVYRA